MSQQCSKMRCCTCTGLKRALVCNSKYRSCQTIANWCQVLVSKKESNVRMKQVSDQKKELHQSHPVFSDFSDSCVNHCSGVGVLLLTDPLGVCRAAWYLGEKVRICPISSMPWYSQAKLNTIFTVLIHVAFYRNMILSSGEDLMEAQLCLAWRDAFQWFASNVTILQSQIPSASGSTAVALSTP